MTTIMYQMISPGHCNNGEKQVSENMYLDRTIMYT